MTPSVLAPTTPPQINYGQETWGVCTATEDWSGRPADGGQISAAGAAAKGDSCLARAPVEARSDRGGNRSSSEYQRAFLLRAEVVARDAVVRVVDGEVVLTL